MTRSPGDTAAGAVTGGFDFSDTETKLLELLSGAGMTTDACEEVTSRLARAMVRSAPDQPSIKPRQNENATTDMVRQKNQKAANRERRR